MSTFILAAQNSTSTKQNADNYARFHDLAISCPNVASGTLVIKGKKPGSALFEHIYSINLASPVTVLFEGTVATYQFTVEDVIGTGEIEITDTAVGGL